MPSSGRSVATTWVVDVLTRAATLDLPGWYLTAGCVFQTVWNTVTGRPPTNGIADYDLFYFDSSDLSWAAEDALVQSAARVFADVPADVQVRSEARVHLWYEEKFGVPCPAYSSTEAAIDSFASTTCCLGVRLEPDGHWRVYAPHGLSDVFDMVHPAEPGAGAARGLRDQDGTLTPRMAGVDCAALAELTTGQASSKIEIPHAISDQCDDRYLDNYPTRLRSDRTSSSAEGRALFGRAGGNGNSVTEATWGMNG